MKNVALQSRIINILLMAVLLTGNTLLAQQIPPPIATEELESVGPIEFINYVGPHTSVDSLAGIIGIGTQLANLDETGHSDYGNSKYSVQQITSDGRLFDADILSLGPNAEIDHIRNLRHIISGYLQAQYGYESDAAYTISIFTTYYNAYYRQNTEYFQQKYNPAVNEAIAPKTIGLSTNYADWPGTTQIIIPISANPLLEQAPSPDLDETGEKNISRYLNDKEKNKQAAKDIRQDMLNLRQKKLNDDQNTLEEKQSALQQENLKTQATMEIAKIKEAATDNLEELEATQAEQQQLKEQLQNNQKSQNKFSATQQTIAQRQESLNKDQRELNQDIPLMKPEESLQSQQEPLPPESEAEQFSPGEFITVLVPVNKQFFQFYTVNRKNLKITKRSPVNSIRSMEFVANDDGYVVIVGKQGKDSYLLRLNKDFDNEAQGQDDIHPDSGVWGYKGQIFAFLGNGKLGRFNMELKLEARSIEVLRPSLRPQFTGSYGLGSYAFVQNQQGKFIWLDMVTLNRKKELIPIE